MAGELVSRATLRADSSGPNRTRFLFDRVCSGPTVAANRTRFALDPRSARRTQGRWARRTEAADRRVTRREPRLVRRRPPLLALGRRNSVRLDGGPPSTGDTDGPWAIEPRRPRTRRPRAGAAANLVALAEPAQPSGARYGRNAAAKDGRAAPVCLPQRSVMTGERQLRAGRGDGALARPPRAPRVRRLRRRDARERPGPSQCASSRSRASSGSPSSAAASLRRSDRGARPTRACRLGGHRNATAFADPSLGGTSAEL